ncbi:MAG: di-heme oxidoredictase family protein [Planctomycetota bacterium]
MHVSPKISGALATLGLGALALVSFPGQGSVEDDPRFIRGKALFDRPFHLIDGVGSPEMNADSCRACHSDPEVGGAGPLELNVSRFARDNGGFGPYQELAGGQIASKLHPPMATTREEYPQGFSTGADVFEQRQPPSILGDGLIDQIPGSAIEANEDPLDADQDGVKGVARRLDIGGTIEIGKYGWKAQVPTVADFVRDAMIGELGMTTSDNGRGFGADTDGDPIADPECTDQMVADIAFYLTNLPAPQRKGSTDPRVALGEQVFTNVGCAKCHVPSLPSPAGPVPLYSNLLLHDIWPADFRGMSEPNLFADADAGMFRTPPLWGIGDTAPYMHDGRAENLKAAIMLHVGEALQVRNAYLSDTAENQEALILFLQDL